MGRVFKEYIFEKFEEWEHDQPGKRSSISAFARWLSENSYEVEIKQQIVNSWIKGSVPKEEKYLLALSEKLGDEVYEILNVDPPNKYLLIVNRVWEFIPEEIQKRISEEAVNYETEEIYKRVSKVPKRRKAAKRK